MSIELEKAALEACGYNARIKEHNGSQWLVAWKPGENPEYAQHWHPLTNINHAMQLLVDCPLRLGLDVDKNSVYCGNAEEGELICISETGVTSKGLIAAQCDAIVRACASLKGVR